MSALAREIKVTLTCKTLPSLDEPADVGLQDKDQNVYAGNRKRDGAMAFECVVLMKDKGNGNIDFAGPFVHGTAAARFMYLSWKRAAPATAALWVQRVKIPLAFTAADLGDATAIRADITGRRPHASEAIAWTMS
ncbi:DUF5990 family protein [Herbaspirillum sp. NPDC101397]|uniref:DUF5990 family protein n=1 Tax=Herbaspirillum sp. NPDC101397 TaxID=3364006 RepID=UPI003839D6F0